MHAGLTVEQEKRYLDEAPQNSATKAVKSTLNLTERRLVQLDQELTSACDKWETEGDIEAYNRVCESVHKEAGEMAEVVVNSVHQLQAARTRGLMAPHQERPSASDNDGDGYPVVFIGQARASQKLPLRRAEEENSESDEEDYRTSGWSREKEQRVREEVAISGARVLTAQEETERNQCIEILQDRFVRRHCKALTKEQEDRFLKLQPIVSERQPGGRTNKMESSLPRNVDMGKANEVLMYLDTLEGVRVSNNWSFSQTVRRIMGAVDFAPQGTVAGYIMSWRELGHQAGFQNRSYPDYHFKFWLYQYLHIRRAFVTTFYIIRDTETIQQEFDAFSFGTILTEESIVEGIQKIKRLYQELGNQRPTTMVLIRRLMGAARGLEQNGNFVIPQMLQIRMREVYGARLDQAAANGVMDIMLTVLREALPWLRQAREVREVEKSPRRVVAAVAHEPHRKGGMEGNNRGRSYYGPPPLSCGFCELRGHGERFCPFKTTEGKFNRDGILAWCEGPLDNFREHRLIRYCRPIRDMSDRDRESYLQEYKIKLAGTKRGQPNDSNAITAEKRARAEA